MTLWPYIPQGMKRISKFAGICQEGFSLFSLITSSTYSVSTSFFNSSLDGCIHCLHCVISYNNNINIHTLRIIINRTCGQSFMWDVRHY